METEGPSPVIVHKLPALKTEKGSDLKQVKKQPQTYW